MADISICQSTLCPSPPDVMVLPLILARRDQAVRIAAICTLSSVAGGVLGYAIGHFLYDSVGQWLMRVYGMQGGIDDFTRWYAEWGAAIILIKGLTPIPFKLVTIASGFAAFNFPLFFLCALLTRAARFFLLSWLLKRYGEPVQAFIEKRLTLVSWLFLAVLVGGFALVMLL
jgi:membrane protein YqaA with SNARE-associated domain